MYILTHHNRANALPDSSNTKVARLTKVDAQLLKAVDLEVLKAEDVQDANRPGVRCVVALEIRLDGLLCNRPAHNVNTRTRTMKHKAASNTATFHKTNNNQTNTKQTNTYTHTFEQINAKKRKGRLRHA